MTDESAHERPEPGHSSPPASPGPTASGQRTAKILVAVLVPLVLLVGGLIWYGATNPERTAKARCGDAVREQLVSPATARFHYDLTWQDGDHWLVNGSVDSQNRFGAVLTSQFRCTVKDGTASVDYLVGG